MPSYGRDSSGNTPSKNHLYSLQHVEDVQKRAFEAGKTEAAGEGITNGLVNLWKSLTGSGMTNAARESAQMEQDFNAQQATIAFERQLQMDNTKMQRAVADYKAAGLNPYALAGQSVSAPAVQSASSSVPSPAAPNLSSLLELITLPSQLRMMKASANAADAAAEKSKSDAAKSDAEKNKIQEDTRGSKLQNDFFEKMRGVREEAEKLDNDLKISEKRSLYKGIEKMDSEIVKNIEEAKSEEDRRNLMVQQSVLVNAEAENIVAMRPFIQAELSAKTSLEREQIRVAAVDEAYRRRLIDSGSIEAAVRATKAQASKDEIDAEVKDAERWLKDYDIHRKAGDLQSWLTGEEQNLGNELVDSLYGAISAISASIKAK